MRPDLLDLIACPSCGSHLEVNPLAPSEAAIKDGSLACRQCGCSFPIVKGIPYLYLNNEEWAPKAKEAQGWVTQHKDQGIYEQGEDSIDLQAPYYPQDPWISVARSMDIALGALNLTGRETILDLGAGRGWAAKQFALKGCRVVALDIVPDENVGLGRAWTLMEDAGVYFHPVIGDGEKLPFQPGSFDIVFCCGAIHHSSNLHLLLSNIHQTLKSGGRLCAINEPSISIMEDEATMLARYASEELALGINETRPNFLQYQDALQSAGLQLVTAVPPFTQALTNHDLRTVAQDMGAVWGGFRLAEPKRSLGQSYNYLRNRFKAWRNGRFPLNHPLPSDERSRLIRPILLWGNVELFLLATKK